MWQKQLVHPWLHLFFGLSIQNPATWKTPGLSTNVNLILTDSSKGLFVRQRPYSVKDRPLPYSEGRSKRNEKLLSNFDPSLISTPNPSELKGVKTALVHEECEAILKPEANCLPHLLTVGITIIPTRLSFSILGIFFMAVSFVVNWK